MEGTLIIILCAIGLVMVLAYMIYRITSHRKKVNRLYDLSREIGSTIPRTGRSRIDIGAPVMEPVVPDNDLIILFHRNGNKVWLSAFRSRLESGSPGLLVTPQPPGPKRREYPAGARTIWLDRSIAHPEESGSTVINPTNLSALFREIEDHFQKGGGKGVLLMDDFESVLTANDPQRVIRFLTMLRGSCARTGYSALVPIAYRAVPQRVRNQLSEAMDAVVMD
ncbi:MAG: DUF835 domain-containing protein [Candidatus Thermoplasmatota archaeon]|nr:DUF835 domain-containing protein [Candidatus Thermoplasmatota archaeon]